MANFEYIALDAKGEESVGTISANDEADASNQLRNQGLYPTNLAPAGKGGGVDSKAKARAKKSQKAKGWKLDFAYSTGVITFSVKDNANQPVFIDSPALVIGRPVSQDSDMKVKLIPDGHGNYQANVPLTQGIWAFQLDGDASDPYHVEGRFYVSKDGTGKME